MAKAVRAKPTKSTSKKLPDMRNWNDEQIADFWETHDSTDFEKSMDDVKFDIDVAEDYRIISLRLETADIEKTKRFARRKGVPYTVLLRMWIKERLNNLAP